MDHEQHSRTVSTFRLFFLSMLLPKSSNFQRQKSDTSQEQMNKSIATAGVFFRPLTGFSSTIFRSCFFLVFVLPRSLSLCSSFYYCFRRDRLLCVLYLPFFFSLCFSYSSFFVSSLSPIFPSLTSVSVSFAHRGYRTFII